MDFVVVGFGIGSICILAGLILRDAPGWWSRLPGRRAPTDDTPAMGRLCRALGAVLLACGVALSIVTLVALFTGLSDGSGALLVASAVTILAIGVVAWGIRWRQRFPPPRRSLAAAAVAATAPVPLAVAIERGLALDRPAAVETDDAVEASGLTVERTVLAQERGEHRAAAEGAAGAQEAGAGRDAEAERRHVVAHAAHAQSADADHAGDPPDPSEGRERVVRDDHQPAPAVEPGAGQQAGPHHDATASETAAHAVDSPEKPRDPH